MTKTFNTLYKITGTGEVQEWTIIVEGNKVFTRFGRHGGKIQESAPDVITEGKNLGKKNATTAEQQAMAEAQAKWEKQLKRGYVKSIEAAQGGEVSDLVTGGVWPMLAKRYDEDKKHIKWPAYGQMKLDGHRCIAMIDAEGKCTLWSRTRKPIYSMPHIITELESLGIKDVTLDGELYNPEYSDKFEKLSHFIRQSEPTAGCEIVHYHIYDIVTPQPFEQRKTQLELTVFGRTAHKYLVQVETVLLADEDDLADAFERFIEAGYEGCMIRNAAGLYVGHPTHRSYDLQKLKGVIGSMYEDAEFKIVGVNEGRGKCRGHGIFVCQTNEGAVFNAKMKGLTPNLKQYFTDPTSVIGRIVTIQFQGYTKKSRVPRFPVALRFREDL